MIGRLFVLLLGVAAAFAIAFGLLVGTSLVVNRAFGSENYEPNLAAWYESLRNMKGQPCCSIADCRTTELRAINGYYEVLIDEHYPDITKASWIRVPDWAAVPNTPNPTKGVVACYWGGEVRCLVTQSEG